MSVIIEKYFILTKILFNLNTRQLCFADDLSSRLGWRKHVVKLRVEIYFFSNLNLYNISPCRKQSDSKRVSLCSFVLIDCYFIFQHCAVSLTQTKKKGLSGKQQLVEDIRSCVEKYSHLYLFSVQNMRNNKLKFIRNEWKDSRYDIVWWISTCSLSLFFVVSDFSLARTEWLLLH